MVARQNSLFLSELVKSGYCKKVGNGQNNCFKIDCFKVIPLEQGLRQLSSQTTKQYSSFKVIPLEQGLRLFMHGFSVLPNRFKVIPLEQGLRLTIRYKKI